MECSEDVWTSPSDPEFPAKKRMPCPPIAMWLPPLVPKNISATPGGDFTGNQRKEGTWTHVKSMSLPLSAVAPSPKERKKVAAALRAKRPGPRDQRSSLNPKNTPENSVTLRKLPNLSVP